MKNLFPLCAVLLSALFVGCEDPVIPEPYFEIMGGNSYVYDLQSRTETFRCNLHYVNNPRYGQLTIKPNCGWISVEDFGSYYHYDGDYYGLDNYFNILINIDENTSGKARSGKIMLKYGTATAEINIIQEYY